MLEAFIVTLVCLSLLVYIWIAYNIPILAFGVSNLRKSKKKHVRDSEKVKDNYLPSFSIIVPVKNEAKVIGRLLKSLLNLEYPKEKVEIIIVEDGSNDETLKICQEYTKKSPNQIKVFHRPFSDGKPSALNFGLKNASGEIIVVFDADSVPSKNVLHEVAKYFKDPRVAAVQGRILAINAEENMLTKFISYEETIWCEAYLRGKDVLGLFVHLKGTCQFIRREILEKLNGFDCDALSEDMEISARITEKGYDIRYAPEACTWQEIPSSFKQLFRQRVRWFGGTMLVAFKYGRLLTRLNKKNIDAETTLLGPFILILSIISYIAAFWNFITPIHVSLWTVFMNFTAIITTATLLVGGLALIYSSKPRKIRSLLWLPFIYIYWCFQAFIALYALLLILLRRPIKWVKTEKNGIIKSHDFTLEC